MRLPWLYGPQAGAKKIIIASSSFSEVDSIKRGFEKGDPGGREGPMIRLFSVENSRAVGGASGRCPPATNAKVGLKQREILFAFREAPGPRRMASSASKLVHFQHRSQVPNIYDQAAVEPRPARSTARLVEDGASDGVISMSWRRTGHRT